ncbi:MAG: DegT/DnrJ/EryC1/StrS family aminotransferase [Flavobacterium sp.]|jgi:perosamine synthetase|nr:DegT/DnrJ/EryC1/StrS family aminotransferase [Flavobacterium sp.]
MNIPITKIEVDKATIDAAVQAIKSGQWLHGKRTEDFEEKFTKLCNTKYAACCSSGTTALFLALKSLGIKKGDEVIVPSFSFVATASAVSMCEATPVFADINSKNFTIDPNDISKKITKKTKGIIPVHLFGHSANMDKIRKIGKDNSLFVLEDAAQAHGSEYKGKPIGSLGDAACFSFYPSKNLTICGDGGMITSNNEELINKIKILRNHGRREKYVHEILGYNLKLSEILAGIGIVRLKKLKKNNDLRRKIAKRYSEELTDDIIKPKEESWTKHVFHQYSIISDRRDDLQKMFIKKKIGFGVFYPLPIHKQPMYKSSNKQKLPITEEICSKIISIPMFPSMKKDETTFVIKSINKFFKSK